MTSVIGCIEIYLTPWNYDLFATIFIYGPHGIMECWNTGYQKRKTVFSQNKVESAFLNDVHQTTIFCFYPNPDLPQAENNKIDSEFMSLCAIHFQ
jgi:hypothetical protein